MNTILSAQYTDPKNRQQSEEETDESIHAIHHDLNITEGSEFLDDALRMIDQPLREPTERGRDNPILNNPDDQPFE